MTREQKRYSYADMLRAVQMCQNGKTVGKASKVCGIPKTTLQNRMKRLDPTELVRKGPKPILPKAAEDDLVSWIAGTKCATYNEDEI